MLMLLHVDRMSALMCVRMRAAWVPLLSGLSSGLISTALLHPFDVAKTSLINPDKRSSGMLALFREIRSQNGWTGMWRGVVPALARISVVRTNNPHPRGCSRAARREQRSCVSCRSCVVALGVLASYLRSAGLQHLLHHSNTAAFHHSTTHARTG